ncbi:MAG: HAD family phosphatase [Propionicimonas sp.]
MIEFSVAAVLWDMDGTLIDSEPLWIEAQTRMVSEHGGSWSHQDGLRLVGSDMDVTAVALQAVGVRLSVVEITDRLTDEVTTALRSQVLWRPGAVELVSGLAEAGVKQAIVTTSSRSMAGLVAEALPAGAIHSIVAGEDVVRGKPDPEPYLLAAERLGVSPASCVAIEDSPTGLAAAIAAGTVAIGVPNDAPLVEAPTWTRLETLVGTTLRDLEAVMASTRPPWSERAR